MNRILMTTPELTQTGGVVSYCRALQNQFQLPVDYFEVGKRQGESALWQTLLRVIRDIFRFQRHLKSGAYDLVHINTSFNTKALLRDGCFAWFARRQGIKVLVYFHGWQRSLEQQMNGIRLGMFKRIFFHATALAVLCSDFKTTLSRWGYSGQIYQETTLVDDYILDQCNSVPKSSETFDVLFLARLEKTKGIYEAIEAVRHVQQTHPHVHLTIAGGGREYDPARHYVEKNRIPQVTFTHVVTDVAEKYRLFQAADVYLFPTYYGEGMPVTVLEALICGVPVITRPDGGVKDFFEDGKMGFITESRDPEVFAAYITRLINDETLRRRMGRYNRQYAQRHFLAPTVVRRLERIYHDLRNPS
ncbi:MAG: glycosyltransferase family 1 protein [Gemmatimonadetes bacterium]|nr:MAG: glycosyltransferase family 1 protein [Gemmatimonadota bacterium]